MVIEVEPALKRRLYAALAIESSTLKQWFIHSATGSVAEHGAAELACNRAQTKEGKAAMNFIKNESAQKLRGGYPPPDLATFLARWVKEISPARTLEPSCGDGVSSPRSPKRRGSRRRPL